MNRDLRKISAVFLIKEGEKYLFQKRKNYSIYKGDYVLPGGHIEANETVFEGAIRELYEELDIKVRECDLEFKMVEPVADYVVFFLEVKNYQGQIKNKEPHKHVDMKFLSLTDEGIHADTLNELIKIEQGISFLQGPLKVDLKEGVRPSARGILITKEKKLVLIKRSKQNVDTYYVTPGGGVEKDETPLKALKRELLEETGSLISSAKFLFHFEDEQRNNSVDFFLCYESKREKPTGLEWTKYHSDLNSYEIVEVSLDEVKKLNLKPEGLKERIIPAFENELEKMPFSWKS